MVHAVCNQKNLPAFDPVRTTLLSLSNARKASSSPFFPPLSAKSRIPRALSAVAPNPSRALRRLRSQSFARAPFACPAKSPLPPAAGAEMAVHYLLRRGISGGSPLNPLRGLLLVSQELGRHPLSSAVAGDAVAGLRSAREDVKQLLKATSCHPILMKLEKKRSFSLDKILNTLRSAQRKAQVMRDAATASQGEQFSRKAKKDITPYQEWPDQFSKWLLHLPCFLASCNSPTDEVQRLVSAEYR